MWVILNKLYFDIFAEFSIFPVHLALENNGGIAHCDYPLSHEHSFQKETLSLYSGSSFLGVMCTGSSINSSFHLLLILQCLYLSIFQWLILPRQQASSPWVKSKIVCFQIYCSVSHSLSNSNPILLYFHQMHFLEEKTTQLES